MLKVGSFLDERYEILGELGEGGFSNVYEALQRSTSQRVAIKVLRPERLSNPKKRQLYIDRFRREMRLIAQLNHSNIVRLLDSSQFTRGQAALSEDQEPIFYLVLEFVEGQSLADLLDQEGSLPPREAVRLMSQVLDALCCAHQNGVVHRDLKPENIMISQTGARRSARVLDFGISAVVESHRSQSYEVLTQTGEFYGTPAYMAPEQMLGEEVTPQADLYAWGLVLLECLQGGRAVQGDSMGQVIRFHVEQAEVALPAPLDQHPLGALIQRSVARDRRDRPRDAAQLLGELEGISLEGLGDLARRPSLQVRTSDHKVAPRAETITSGGLFCSGCRQPNNLGASFCQHCGQHLARRQACPGCDAEVTPAMNFCQDCGQDLGLSSTSATVRGSMSAPGKRRDTQGPRRSATTTGSSRAERRQITILSASMEISSSAPDPEDMMEALHGFRDLCRRVCQQREVHIARQDSDELLVYLGYPVAQEDDPRRAVRLGLALEREVEALGQPLGLRMALRVGIHTGLVVGETSPQTGAVSVIGQAPGVAARLRGAVPRGVVVSASTAPLLRDAFTLEDLGSHHFTLLSHPLRLFKVLGPSAEGPSTQDAPLVGRQQELDILKGLWRQVREGRGQVALLLAEAGVGKTRLLDALNLPTRRQQSQWWCGRCAPELSKSAFAPLIGALEAAAGLDPSQESPARLASLEALARRAGVCDAYTVPWLAELLNISLEGSAWAPPQVGPVRRRVMTLEALHNLILGLAEAQALVLVLEDLHWADPSTLELLHLLVDQAPTAHLLALLTARPSFVPPWKPRAHITQVTLGHLSRGQVDELTKVLLGGRALPPAALELVVERADGVPLYVEEVVRTLLASGALREQEEGYLLGGPLPELEIPATLRGFLTARLDRLGEARQTAQLCAVLGRQFSPRLLERVSPLEPGALQRHLEVLIDAEFLHRRGRGARAVLLHKHALLQESAYASLLRGPRRELHLLAAQALEEGFPEVVRDQPELIAQHYTQAQRHHEALTYWRRAGELASRRSANQEAIHHFRRALGLLRDLPHPQRLLREELQLLVALGSPLTATSGYANAEVAEVYGRAREICAELGQAPELFPVIWGLWVFYHTRSQLETARELAQTLVQLAQASGQESDHLEAVAALGATLFCQGDALEGTRLLMEGASLYRPERHHALAYLFGHDPGVFCKAHAAWGLQITGRLDAAKRTAMEAIELARQLDHPNSLALALHFAAAVYQMNGEPDGARACSQAQVELAGEEVLPFWLAGGTAWHAWADLRQGDPGALARLHEGMARWRSMGTELVYPHFMGLLAEAHLEAGRLHAAMEQLEQALRLVQKHQERYYEPELYRLKGDVLEAQGHLPEAEAAWWQAMDLSKERQQHTWGLRATLALIRSQRRRAIHSPALPQLEALLRHFEPRVTNPDLEAARGLLTAL